MAGIFVIHFCEGILRNGRAVYRFTPPQPEGASFAPECNALEKVSIEK